MDFSQINDVYALRQESYFEILRFKEMGEGVAGGGVGGGCPWPSDGRLKDLNILKSFSFLDAKKTGLMKTFKTN